MKKRHLIFLMIWLMPSLILGNHVQLLTDHIGSSPKMIALGNIEGMDFDSSSIFDNPAALMKTRLSAASMQTQLSDSETAFLCVSTSVPFLNGHLGFGVMSIQSSNLDKTAIGDFNQFYSASTFSTTDALYLAAYQQLLAPNLSGAVTVKYADQDLYETRGKGVNADIGFVWDPAPLRLSLGFKNILPNSPMVYSQDQTAIPFPFQATLGARYQWSDLAVLGQVKYHEEGHLILKAAAVEYAPSFTTMAVYGGWKEIPVSAHTCHAYSVGARLALSSIAISVSYELSDFIGADSRRYISFDVKL
ncbi:MAG: hypothetical protein AB7F28_05820 [Candidatus Margulisiibacteriota bacterium]